ncbi:hypothetical protein HKD37_09G024957 [Glycine soja]
MGKVEEVKEQMKADMKAMKEQMATMMKAMMSTKKIMEANVVAVAATNTVAKYGRPPSAFPPYGLPLNYTPPNVAYTPGEDVNNSAPILIESRQPHHVHVSQSMGETYEIPHHNLANFEPCLGYATEGQAVGGIPLQNTLEGPQFCPQPQPLHSTTVFASERIEVGLKRGKFDHPALTNEKTGANEEAKVPQPPFFRGYDFNATCAYHGGAPGHSIEHCSALKHKVQGLINAGWLKFEENRL